MPQTFTSREYNQNASLVKRAANNGPVIITERGKPAHVLMTIDAFEKLQRDKRTVPLVTFLQSLALSDLDLKRDADVGRDDPF